MTDISLNTGYTLSVNMLLLCTTTECKRVTADSMWWRNASMFSVLHVNVVQPGRKNLKDKEREGEKERESRDLESYCIHEYVHVQDILTKSF